jgi:hypothetical protein
MREIGMAKALAVCPVCEGALQISELECTRCHATIHSAFTTCRFCRLGPEHLTFIELFLRCEGNLSRVEKELNLSYPTVRNRLSAAVVALGLLGGDVVPDPATEEPRLMEKRRSLLDELARGELSAEEVAEALKRIV